MGCRLGHRGGGGVKTIIRAVAVMAVFGIGVLFGWVSLFVASFLSNKGDLGIGTIVFEDGAE